MSGQRFQRGFTLAAGVFLLVVLAALGAFVLQISTAQHVGAAYDIQGSRAYQAARAGIEWGAYEALRFGRCDAAGSSFSPGGSLSEFSVRVVGALQASDELGTPVRVCSLTATACNQSGAGCPNPDPADHYIERQLQASVAW